MSNARSTTDELNRQFRVGLLRVSIHENENDLGREAASAAAFFIRDSIQRRGKARLLFSAANSQLKMIASLAKQPDIEWQAVEVFHVDEYVGIPLSHPQSFAGWVKRNLVSVVQPGSANYIAGDAIYIEEECQRYASALTQEPIDVSFLGIGENGHIGFNDPHAADFADPKVVKLVTLDQRCREQQVREGHWRGFSDVPTVGFAVTCPALINAAHVVCCVPGINKAEAVRNTLEGPIDPSCPASCLRTHPDAELYIDVHSSSLLSRDER
ncbi:MAG TPA: glucosamine-6-phosphate deaminase [Terriglobales bacterium]|nr:glucosamine-6-phosphate deaminase [Terriglobales bacterium]